MTRCGDLVHLCIFGEPWALFSLDLFTVGPFLAKFLLSGGNFLLETKVFGAFFVDNFSLHSTAHTEANPFNLLVHDWKSH